MVVLEAREDKISSSSRALDSHSDHCLFLGRPRTDRKPDEPTMWVWRVTMQ